jgi:hypothetical protein
MTSNASQAQFEINKPYWYPGTNYNSLYVQVGDTTAPYAKQITKYIRENWNLCPVQFVNDKLLSSWLTEGNLFLSMSVYTMVSQVERNRTTFSDPVYNDYFYLHFWTIDKKYKPEKPIIDQQFTVARAELFYKRIGRARMNNTFKTFEIIEDPKNILTQNIKPVNGLVYHFTDSAFATVFLNGMPENIKNIVQFVNYKLSKQEYRNLFDNEKSLPELNNLKKDTLFFPNYYYGAQGTMIDDFKEDDKIYLANVKAIDELLTAYPYKIELISREALDQKIRLSPKPVYYLNYIQSSADKMVSIVNGKTGAILYSENTKKSYRLRDKDLERIGKSIE